MEEPPDVIARYSVRNVSAISVATAAVTMYSKRCHHRAPAAMTHGSHTRSSTRPPDAVSSRTRWYGRPLLAGAESVVIRAAGIRIRGSIGTASALALGAAHRKDAFVGDTAILRREGQRPWTSADGVKDRVAIRVRPAAARDLR